MCTNAHTLTQILYAHTQAHTHAHIGTNTHIHTHTHTQIHSPIHGLSQASRVSVALQNSLHEFYSFAQWQQTHTHEHTHAQTYAYVHTHLYRAFANASRALHDCGGVCGTAKFSPRILFIRTVIDLSSASASTRSSRATTSNARKIKKLIKKIKQNIT